MQKLTKADGQGVLLAGQTGVMFHRSASGVMSIGEPGKLTVRSKSGVLVTQFGQGAVSPAWVIWSYTAYPPAEPGGDATIDMSVTMARSVDNLDFTLIDNSDTVRSLSTYVQSAVQTWNKTDIGTAYQGKTYDFRIRVTLKGVLFDVEVVAVEAVTIPVNGGDITSGGGEA